MKKHITKHILLLIVGLLCSVTSFSQVTVAGSTAANGVYANLSLAFTIINASAQTGNNITITITGLANQAGASAALNVGTWASLTIMPGVGGGTIQGNPGNPLIDLNGVTNVIIDGRVGGVGPIALTLNNTSTGGGNTSTIRFTGGATSNAVRYCNIYGSESNGNSGILLFANSGGNSGNIIEYNNITTAYPADLSKRPKNVVFSQGAAGLPNNSNQILNNNIYDFMPNGGFGTAIKFDNYSTNWTISGNSFYETQTLTGGAAESYVIYASNKDMWGNYSTLTGTYGMTITDNYFGGSAPLCAGASTFRCTGNSKVFMAIMLNLSTGGVKNQILRNSIKKIEWNIQNLFDPRYFTGIHIQGTQND
jgi:hypothetical protein